VRFPPTATVNHGAEEYVRTGGFHHTNTVEGYFSLLKRGIYGTYNHVSQQHLKGYLAELQWQSPKGSGQGGCDRSLTSRN
jgi:hypothetical protein